MLSLTLQRTESEAGAAYGAALLGGVSAGVFADARSAAQLGVRVTAEIEPDPDWAARYAEQRDRYRALYPALAALKS